MADNELISSSVKSSWAVRVCDIKEHDTMTDTGLSLMEVIFKCFVSCLSQKMLLLAVFVVIAVASASEVSYVFISTTCYKMQMSNIY